MTKLRPPVSAEDALTRVAGVITWEAVAAIAGQSDRTVRNWSDPDTRPTAEDAITLAVALKLDVAYRTAGGQGAPMLHYLATRLEADCLAAAPDCAAIALAAATAAKESGEAIAAAITASLPCADPRDLAVAERELDDSIRAQVEALGAVRARRQALQTVSGPEVPPPPDTS